MEHNEKVRKVALEIIENQPGTLWSKAVRQAEESIENMRKYDEATKYYRNRYR